MNYRLISSKQILSKINRDLKPAAQDWKADAIEWLGEVAEFTGSLPSMESVALPLRTKNHRVQLPTNLESIIAVEYQGSRLPESGSQIGHALGQGTDSGSGIQYEGNYYLVKPGVLITSFEADDLILHYNALPVDKEGYPLLADNVFLREAAKWYIAMMLCNRNALPNFTYKDCESRWHEYRVRAEADIAFPSPEKMERFRNAWVRLIPNTYQSDTFFIGSENPEIQ